MMYLSTTTVQFLRVKFIDLSQYMKELNLKKIQLN